MRPVRVDGGELDDHGLGDCQRPDQREEEADAPRRHGNLVDDATLALLKQREAFLVPTLVTDVTLKRVGLDIGQSRSSWEKIVSVLDAGMDALERAHRAGVQIAFGTDLLGPTHPHQNEEFTILGQVQPPLAVVQSATLTAARLIGQEGSRTLEPRS